MQRMQDAGSRGFDLPTGARSFLSVCHPLWADDVHGVPCGMHELKDPGPHGGHAVMRNSQGA